MVLRLARQLEARFPLWEKRVSIFVMTPVRVDHAGWLPHRKQPLRHVGT
ncbi:MAG: hypothetical protein PWP41_754 [Moorella sp. (in: firmicutes)]|nr:hypothetical protein [Moorella sp. (in: firmicutes)]